METLKLTIGVIPNMKEPRNNWGQYLTLRYHSQLRMETFPSQLLPTQLPPSFNPWRGKRDNPWTNPTTEPLKTQQLKWEAFSLQKFSSRSSFDKIMSLAHLRVHRVEARPAQGPWQFVIHLSLLHHKVPWVVLKQPKFSQFWLNSYNIVQKAYWSQLTLHVSKFWLNQFNCAVISKNILYSNKETMC